MVVDFGFTPGQDFLVGAVIATEVPPLPSDAFPLEAIPLAAAAVADVIRNRVGVFASTAVEVVLEPNQFSAVCREPYWRKAMAGTWFPAHVQRCVAIWQESRLRPAAHAATYYFSPVSMRPGGSVPGWVAAMDEVFLPDIPTRYFRWFRPRP